MAKISGKIRKNGESDEPLPQLQPKRAKRTRSSAPRESPPRRSSVFRGVTRHRWTGRFEAHLWDKNCWNESQNKKGKQVYLGAYDDEAIAARAYDLAALKYWGRDTILNFPVSNYEEEVKEMDGQSKEEYIGSLRRKSSGFSRGVSKYRGVARHHHNGRWEARIGRVFGNKYLYLGTYATQEEAATAYDMAAIEYRGLNAVTNFDLSRYINFLPPNNSADHLQENVKSSPNVTLSSTHDPEIDFASSQQLLDEKEISVGNSLLSSSEVEEISTEKFVSSSSEDRDVLEPSTPPELVPSRRSFPEDIQTYFGCHEFSMDDDVVFGNLNSFVLPMFHDEFDKS